MKGRDEGAFIPFIVGILILKLPGYCETYVENGADALEIGFAFSDPVADGPTVQEADIRALNSGITNIKVLNLSRKSENSLQFL